MGVSRKKFGLCLSLMLLLSGQAIVTSTPAGATYAGTNGRIYFEQGKNILSANPDGSDKAFELRTKWFNGRTLWDPAPSPNGLRLAFSAGASDIFVLNTVTDKFKNVTRAASDKLTLTGIHYPTWSPNGKVIVFQALKTVHGIATARLYRINLDGTGIKQLIKFGSFFGGVQAMPDWGASNHIAFAFNDDIYTINPDGTGLANLTTVTEDGEEPYVEPSWSPDGLSIATEHAVDGSYPQSSEPGIVVIDATTGDDVTTVTGNAGVGTEKYSSPTWSPDGQSVAFSGFDTGKNQEYDIYTAPVTNNATLTEIQVTNDIGGSDALAPAWGAATP